MEFEELQKIWDVQNNQPLYAINENALYNRILAKRNTARHITNVSELLTIIVNIMAGLFILGATLTSKNGNTFMYILSAWMFVTALYSLVSRVRRIKAERRFDRSLLGDLDHALSVASYQVRFSQLMRWNILPIGMLIILGTWSGGKPIWMPLLMLIFFAVVWWASEWEHGIYVRKKREFEGLRGKLAG